MQRALIWWILSVGLAGSAWAGQVVTEAELLAALAPEAPAAKALAGEPGAAAARLTAARQMDNPEIGVAREDAPDVEWTLGVAWTPPLDGRRALAREAAAAGVEAAESGLGARLFALRRELRAIYAGWALASERRMLLAGYQVAVEELAARLTRQAEAGEASGLEAGRLELAALRARAELERAEADLEQRRAAVRVWLAGLPDDAVPERPDLPEASVELDPARHDLEALRSEVEQRRLETRLSRRFTAAPELEAGWKQVEAGGLTFEGPVFGIRWSVPVADRRQAEREAASAELEAAEARLVLAERRAAAELDGARAAYSRLRRAVFATEPAAAPRLLTAATEAYRLGEVTIAELFDTLDALRDAHLDHLDLYAAALAAQRDLEKAVGRSLGCGGSR